ncbi:hypothetical protein KQH89_16385, partial [Vibrio cholerae]|uniref:hypothetical protein n=1 Tax=Vibrio cholerae TaxID=666 RepID=UPI001C12735E
RLLLIIGDPINVEAIAPNLTTQHWLEGQGTVLLVVMGWVIFRAENLHVAGRMYGAMFSFGEWSLSELNRANLTG